jgi:hypothetical protein
MKGSFPRYSTHIVYLSFGPNGLAEKVVVCAE